MRGPPGCALVGAAKLAGYGKNSTAHVLNSIAQDLFSKQCVVDLISEITRKQIRSAAPEAVAAVREIITDPEHGDRLKAAQTILERIEPTMQRLDVRVKHETVDQPLRLSDICASSRRSAFRVRS